MLDMISAEYGWTDSQILDLTMDRIRQIHRTVTERVEEERKRALRVKEFELQTLVGAVHAAAGNKKGARAAGRIRLYKRDPDNSMDRIQKVFKVDEGAGGLLDQAEVQRKVAELRAARGATNG